MVAAASAVSGFDLTNGTGYTTAAFTPVAGKSYLLAAVASNSADPGAPTLSGTNGTGWTLAASANPAAAVISRIYVWHKAFASGAVVGNGTITITWAAAAARCVWVLLEITDGDPTFVQAVAATGTAATSGSVTLAALRAATSLCVGFFEHHANEGSTVGSGFDLEFNSGAIGEALSLLAESKANDTGVDASWTSSVLWGGIAVEIANLRSLSSASTWTVGVSSLLQKMKGMASSSTWTFGTVSLLQKMKNMVSSSTWTVTIGSSMQHLRAMASSSTWVVTIGSALSRYTAWLRAAAPDAQTASEAAPDTQTLAMAAPDTQTADTASPDTQTATGADPDAQTLTGASPDEIPS
jgi:hypothetical protein